MNILLTGATGFIGQHLVRRLLQDEHQLTVLTRQLNKAYRVLGSAIDAIDSLRELDHLNNFDAVINLAGEPIANLPWTPNQRQRICDSRWHITQQLSELCLASSNPPRVFLSGSAIGYYGYAPQDAIDENADFHDNSFAHMVCKQWEKLALSAASEHTRVCLLRTGVVLGKEGGMLSRLLPVYRAGLGGPIGTGQQIISWIHIHDMVEGIVYLLNNESAQGAYNLTAPNAVSNAKFAKSLAQHLHRPSFMHTPAWLLNLTLGDMAKLITEGSAIAPLRLQNAGFLFRYAQLDEALDAILDKESA